MNYFILGNGSNLLVSDNGYYGVVILIHENNFSNLEIQKENENIGRNISATQNTLKRQRYQCLNSNKNCHLLYILKVGGGMLMKTLSIEACLLSLTGLEDIIEIPGTVGGGIIMNASFRKNGLNNPLKKVKIITPEGILKELTKEECWLVHRGSLLKNKKYLVIEASFKLNKGDQLIIQKTMTDNTKIRYQKQPMYFGSAGCFFVWDHSKHGSMYEKYKESNLVSYRIGNAMIYTYNIAFIENLGKANGTEVMEVVSHLEKIMKKNYGIEVRREVITIGSFNGIDYY